MESLIGQRLGPYLLEAELGRGSMGIVCRARHATDGKTYAVKVLLDSLATDISFVTRFIREARVVAGLHHPNIVRVYEAGREGQHIYFAMEFFPGVTAGALLRERKRLPAGQVVEIVAQAADALEYAHTVGHLVHRDIKPENLLVDRWFRAKVLDFGLARIEGMRSITQAGTVVGSLYYVAPEQLLGRTLDGRTDVYALGISMYEMLTGRRPYRGQTLTEMSDAILSAVAVPLSQIEPSVPREVERIVARAMARDLSQRYIRAADLRDDLRAVQAKLFGGQAEGGNAPLPFAREGAAPQTPGQARPTHAPRATLRPASLQPVPAEQPPARPMPPHPPRSPRD